MIKRVIYSLCLLFVFFSLTLVTGSYFYPKAQLNPLTSPVLGISKNTLADNIWFPNPSKFTESMLTQGPEITAESAFFVDTQSGEVLYEKSPHKRLRIASLTKIMTVILSREYKGLTDTFTVSGRAAAMEPDKMLLQAGETMQLQELLDGIFLVSANDAAEVLSEQTTGDRADFIKQMNIKSQSLGMKDSLFINPTGLEEDLPDGTPDAVPQYSSAYDLILASHYLIRNWPDTLDISSQPHIYIPQTENHQDYDLYSGINLLTTYPGVVGLKTGYTPEAGLTLVTIAQRGGHEVMGVILNATNRRDDAKLLLDYSFKKLGVI